METQCNDLDEKAAVKFHFLGLCFEVGSHLCCVLITSFAEVKKKGNRMSLLVCLNLSLSSFSSAMSQFGNELFAFFFWQKACR